MVEESTWLNTRYKPFLHPFLKSSANSLISCRTIVACKKDSKPQSVEFNVGT